LHAAASKDNYDVIPILIKAGLSVNSLTVS